MINVMMNYAKSFIGVPYIWGGNNPIEGFDCSGYVLECLRSVGFKNHDMRAVDLHKTLSGLGWRSGLREGSILFFGDSRNKITHVEIAISTQLMIGASGGGRNTISREIASQQNAFVKIRPINSRGDLVACLIPELGKHIM